MTETIYARLAGLDYRVSFVGGKLLKDSGVCRVGAFFPRFQLCLKVLWYVCLSPHNIYVFFPPCRQNH